MRTAVVAASFALLLGCGAADQTKAARSDDEENKLVDVTPGLNLCPRFEGSIILPQSIPVDGTAFIAVRAVDPDADDLDLAYSWSASAGEFSKPDESVTDYRCGEPGDQVLTVNARDTSDCDTELHLDVTCLSE